MVQRIALDQRPAFFIVAGQRGGGKTTLASMITTAAMGRQPAAAAWASNEDERRKALLSHLRVGAASVEWDNIPRGASIKCPHVERALTLAEYTDRILGVSEQLTVNGWKREWEKDIFDHGGRGFDAMAARRSPPLSMVGASLRMLA
jgi:hypothetical protein